MSKEEPLSSEVIEQVSELLERIPEQRLPEFFESLRGLYESVVRVNAESNPNRDEVTTVTPPPSQLKKPGPTKGRKHKNPRKSWSQELHGQFVSAWEWLDASGTTPTPKKIIAVMRKIGADVSDLTVRQVQSHHQKYKEKVHERKQQRQLTSTVQLTAAHESLADCNPNGDHEDCCFGSSEGTRLTASTSLDLIRTPRHPSAAIMSPPALQVSAANAARLWGRPPAQAAATLWPEEFGDFGLWDSQIRAPDVSSAPALHVSSTSADPRSPFVAMRCEPDPMPSHQLLTPALPTQQLLAPALPSRQLLTPLLHSQQLWQSPDENSLSSFGLQAEPLDLVQATPYFNQDDGPSPLRLSGSRPNTLGEYWSAQQLATSGTGCLLR